MFTRQWSTSERKYDVIVDRDIKVPHARRHIDSTANLPPRFG